MRWVLRSGDGISYRLGILWRWLPIVRGRGVGALYIWGIQCTWVFYGEGGVLRGRVEGVFCRGNV